MNNISLIRPAVILCVCALLGTSCQKYVDIKTQGKVVPGAWLNYRYLLNYTSNFNGGVSIPDYASDDAQLVDGSYQVSSLVASDYYGFAGRAYSWQPVVYPNTGYYYTDANWDNCYSNITNANVVIEEVPAVTDATEDQKNELMAEAMVHRADAYLMLVNTYAKTYDASTAASDPGVPLVLVETTTQSLVRQSIQQTYDQIIKDLKTAAPNLPVSQTYNMLPSRASAFAELARCYLYMNLYDSANRYADSVLSYRSTLNDLGSYSAPLDASVYPLQKNDPELLLLKNAAYGSTGYSPNSIRLSDTLLSVLGTTDQRYALFTLDAASVGYSYTAAGGRFWIRDRVMGEARNVGPTVPEMMLIKAEYYARSGDAASAMNWVNKLRVKRFKPADYTDMIATDASDAVVQVIKEREREFFCRMLRWWDMRRLKSEARFRQTLTRSYNGTTYTLDPSSNRYVFQIAPYYLKLNPEIQQNP